MKFHLLVVSAVMIMAAKCKADEGEECIPSLTIPSDGGVCQVDCPPPVTVVTTIQDEAAYQYSITERLPFPQTQSGEHFEFRVIEGIIPRGSRSPAAIYEFGDVRCVESGELTLLQSGKETTLETYTRGECVAIAQGVATSFVNLSEEEDVVYYSYHMILPDSTGITRCEEPPPSDPDAWVTGLLPCDAAGERGCDEVFEDACEIYATCVEDYKETEGWKNPCLDNCVINGEKVPTSTWTVPDREPGSPYGRSEVHNGQTIPMVPSWAVAGGHSGHQVEMDIQTDEDNMAFKYVVEHTTRLPGTRAVTHTHDSAGVTCLYQGEMTLLLDLLEEPVIVQAGTCYWMPARRYMSGINTGNVTALMWDMFVLPDDPNAVPLNAKELFENTETFRVEAQAYCESPDAPPLFVEEPIDCCDGNAVQNQTTAQPLYWKCPTTDSDEEQEGYAVEVEDPSPDEEDIVEDSPDEAPVMLDSVDDGKAAVDGNFIDEKAPANSEAKEEDPTATAASSMESNAGKPTTVFLLVVATGLVAALIA